MPAEDDVTEDLGDLVLRVDVLGQLGAHPGDGTHVRTVRGDPGDRPPGAGSAGRPGGPAGGQPVRVRELEAIQRPRYGPAARRRRSTPSTAARAFTETRAPAA